MARRAGAAASEAGTAVRPRAAPMVWCGAASRPRGRPALRLSEEERRAIRAACEEVFGPRATVRLFGSRVRDEARGGDLDLLVESDPSSNNLNIPR